MTICNKHVVITIFQHVLLYPSNTVSLNFTSYTTFTCAVTNIIHQNSDFSQFLSHARTHSHTQEKLMTSYVPSTALPLSFSQISAILGQKFPR